MNSKLTPRLKLLESCSVFLIMLRSLTLIVYRDTSTFSELVVYYRHMSPFFTTSWGICKDSTSSDFGVGFRRIELSIAVITSSRVLADGAVGFEGCGGGGGMSRGLDVDKEGIA